MTERQFAGASTLDDEGLALDPAPAQTPTGLVGRPEPAAESQLGHHPSRRLDAVVHR